MRYGSLGLLFALPAVGSANIITFDEFGGQPSTFDTAQPVNDKYLSLGVKFRGPNGSKSNGGVLIGSGSFTVPAHSGPVFLGFSRIAEGSDGGAPISPEELTFTTPINQVSIFAASVDSSHAANFTLTAYDAQGHLLGSNSLTLQVIQWGQLSFSAPSISKVVLNETTNAHTFVFDDLSYQPVPEPASLLVLGLGVGIVGCRRPKKSQTYNG